MNTTIKKEIILDSENSPNEEICGFIYYTFHEVKLFKCKNISNNKIDSFEISNDDYLECLKLGKPCGIYHSHPQSDSAFSQDDLDIADEMMLPIYVYSLVDKKFKEFIPSSYYLEYEGLPFCLGFFDCLGICRIYFRQKFNIYISDYDRDETYHNDEKDVITENFEKEGFIKSLDNLCLQKHDILVSSSNLGRPQHFSIFLGNSRMLEHRIGRLSKIEMINNESMRKVKYVLRYKNPL